MVKGALMLFRSYGLSQECVRRPSLRSLLKKTGREHFEGMLMKEGQWSRMAWELSDAGSVLWSREDVQDPRPIKL